ncbi:MAG: hypothetical protein WD380_12210 [Gaiellaceae bacterium]
MTSHLVTEFVERLDGDRPFTTAFEDDPFATLRNEGFGELATAAEHDRDRIGELVDRIYRDDEFRQKVEQDPIGELIGWGLPEDAIGHVLLIAGAPAEVVDRATADVEAHISARTAVAVAAVLGSLAFAQQASASVQPAQSTVQTAAQVAPQLTAQVSPQERVQVAPQIKAQVKPAAKLQISRQDRTQWHGVQPQLAKAQFASFMGIHRSGL